MLHGLKKVRFSTSNTCSVSGDKTTAAQNQNFIVLFSSCTKCCLFKLCPFFFSFHVSLYRCLLFGAIVYLLSR